mmetsp:Transcript_19171/g.29210  ORF Transcript_19171/g.29210 Transcript_19171/m.29210 type:complete len:165 (+) Transcript_19171:129-623(+)
MNDSSALGIQRHHIGSNNNNKNNARSRQQRQNERKMRIISKQCRAYRLCPLDLVFDRCFLTMSYNSMNDAQGAKAEDFVNIGKRCRIESIQYRTHTTSRAEPRKSSSTTIYECDETWRYDFVVLLEEEKGDDVQQQDSSIDTSYNKQQWSTTTFCASAKSRLRL